MNIESPLDLLFNARHVAVIGASARSEFATGNQVVRNLQRAGYTGSISVVHPSSDEIESVATVRSVPDLGTIDVAVVAVAAARVGAVLVELEAARCAAAIVMSVGLDGEALASVAQYRGPGRMLVHGPNCMGVISVADSLRLWAEDDNLANLSSGDIAIVSQSGSAAIFVARSVQGRGFSRIISTGNEAATTTADYVRWLAGDERTSVIGLVVESISDPADFRDAVRHAREAGKAVVVLKVGRSENGARATQAHTGALVSSDTAYEAFFRELDLPLVADYDELSSTLELLSVLGSRSVGAGRVGVVTISGGQAALSADSAASVGVSLPVLSESTREALDVLFLGSPVNNPLDAAATAEVGEPEFGRAIELMGGDPQIDVVVAVLDAQVTLSESELSYEAEYFAATLAAQCSVPVIVASSSSHTLAAGRSSTADGAVAVLRGLRNTFVAIKSATSNARPVMDLPPRPEGLPDADEVEALKTRLRAVDGPVTGPLLARILDSYGIRGAQSAVFASGIEAAAYADSIGYPVVVKVQSPQITHRTEVGGVVTGISDAPGVMAAVADIAQAVRTHRPDAEIEGFEVQRQLVSHVEGFTGLVVDPILGPSVVVGMGGTLVELLGDTRHAMAPVSAATAGNMIAETVLGRLLDGYRAIHPTTPTADLADLVSRASWLGHDLSSVLLEADFNPVLVEEISGEARIVDALLISRGRSTENDHEEVAEVQAGT